MSKNCLLCEIASILEMDPTSVSKEVKRNRIPYESFIKLPDCDKLKRWPYVCKGCTSNTKYCIYKRYHYDAKIAQSIADEKLVVSRKGIDLDSDEFKVLDEIVKNGVDNNHSIYHIATANKTLIKKTAQTLYRYINNGYLTTKRIDLPYATKYKKRHHRKEYEYLESRKIDRSGHTYPMYLSYMHNNRNSYVWQLDFLGAIKTDTKKILSLSQPDSQFPLLGLINNPNSKRIVSFFDELELKLGANAFKNIFPVILTDRDPCFSDIDGICTSKITGEERCKIFYCDPYVSSQKANVENLNKQLRKYFPKKKSIQNLTLKEVREKNFFMINQCKRSLDGFSPKEVFASIFGEGIIEKLL